MESLFEWGKSKFGELPKDIKNTHRCLSQLKDKKNLMRIVFNL